jgi:arsenite methyltransferase
VIRSLTCAADVVIQDANNDLNVYIDTLPDGIMQNKDAGGEGKQNSTCCAVDSTLSTTCCSPEKKASGCCSTESDGNGCCTTTKNTGQDLDLASLAAEIGEIDLNEWVGEYQRKPV